jgi:hypothetical protein
MAKCAAVPLAGAAVFLLTYHRLRVKGRGKAERRNEKIYNLILK